MSQNISVADRLAERLKASDMGSLMSEEDVYDLAKQAIKAAFFENRITPSTGYGSPTVMEPLLNEVARESFKAAMDVRIKAVAAALAATPEFGEIVSRAVINHVVAYAGGIGPMIVGGAMAAEAGLTMEMVGKVVRREFDGR